MRKSSAVIVVMHAPCWKEGLEWYEAAFQDASRTKEEEGEFEYLVIDGIVLEVVNADEKVPVGAAGTIVYWATENFEDRLAYLLSIGATIYRGPMTTVNGLKLCQIKDPFGNSFGIRGAV